jgi:hypothetical protein
VFETKIGKWRDLADFLRILPEIVKIGEKSEKQAENREKFDFGAVWRRFRPKNWLKMA